MPYPGSVPLYPPADRYVEAFGEAQLRHWLARRNIGGIVVPLSVRTQPPLKKYTRKSNGARKSLVRKTPTGDAYLAREIGLVADLLPPRDREAFRKALAAPAEDAEGDVLGMGPGAFGRIGPVCYQNHERQRDYRAALDAGRLPVWRGLELTPDDLVRRAVMEALARHGRVSMEAIEIAHVIDFRRYFAIELQELEQLARERLIHLEGDWIVLAGEDRNGLARVCEVFDRYMRSQREHASLERVI